MQSGKTVCARCGLLKWRRRHCNSYLCAYERRVQEFYRSLKVNGSCLEWQGYINKKGYGRTSWFGNLCLTHRLSWFLVFNEWPNNQLDHLCENTKCVKVSHLQDVTLGDHIRITRERKCLV